MRKKKTVDSTSITIIRLKLCRPIGCEVEEFWKALNECGYRCDIARNAMFRYWIRWREDNKWDADPLLDKSGNVRHRKNGDVIQSNCPAPAIRSEERPAPSGSICRWCRGEGKQSAIVSRLGPDGDYEPVCEKHRLVTFQTALYRHATDTCSDLSSSVISGLSAEVWKSLSANAPFVPGNRALYKWQSYLWHEASLPSCRSRRIPVPNRTSSIAWDDCCWIEFPLWSKSHSGTQKRYRVECKVANLPAGKKRILEQAIRGELKISDSYLIDNRARNGADWELHVVIRHPDDNANLDANRTLILSANDCEASRPFSLTIPTGEVYGVGSGLPVVMEYKRLTIRRKAIRGAGRLGTMKGGHGKRRVMRAVTGESRRYGGIQSQFYRDLADRVYQSCVRNNCGTVEYDEPPVNVRDKLWFASRETPINWEQLKARLIGALKRRGIVFSLRGVTENV